MSMPNKLRIRDGVLCLADGGDVVAYLTEAAKGMQVGEDTPICILKTSSADTFYNAYLQYNAEMGYALCA